MAQSIIMGILAHVDAGKTTLSEVLLYRSGAIRRQGRVDNKDTFLDTNAMEREHGITIYSKQARFSTVVDGVERTYTILDTPGHVDFSAEMERTLQVLDYAVVVISAPDGVTGQVRTLWRLLDHYHVPAFFFVNKMDQLTTPEELAETPSKGWPEHIRGKIMAELSDELKGHFVDMDRNYSSDQVQEELALCSEELMDAYLEGTEIRPDVTAGLIRSRSCFPVIFGSALKDIHVDRLMETMDRFMTEPERKEEFGARVYKITRDESGSRLTWMKITGGSLKVKTMLTMNVRGEEISEKADQIRIYSGEKFTPAREAEAGQVCAVTGLTATYAGQGIGVEENGHDGLLQPVVSCQIILPPTEDKFKAYRNLRLLEEEDPVLHVIYDEDKKEITAQVMGEMQREVLQRTAWERFKLPISFGAPGIVYKETIQAPVEGVGHFEPLRHYAEVHLLLEPGEPGSGLVFESRCSVNELARNWQRLIMTHLEERRHRGVLTGSEITDMKISIIGGRAHEKHTEGGDFRQATYRAVRQGLMMARCSLLEPYYDFRLEIPGDSLGHALTDLTQMGASFGQPDFIGDRAVLEGSVPVSSMGDYARDLNAYTRGEGTLSVSLKGYGPCHNEEEVIEKTGYDPEMDLRNPSSSVFCSHGAGTVIPWYEVRDYMQVDTGWQEEDTGKEEEETIMTGYSEMTGRRVMVKDERDFSARQRDYYAGEEELKAIFERTYGPIKSNIGRREEKSARTISSGSSAGVKYRKPRPVPEKEYLLVDGYNIIFAWDDLKALAEKDLKAARDKLMDILSNFAGFRRESVILVYDAYRVSGGKGSVIRYHNIDVVFTKEAETADLYIEKTTHELVKNYKVTVATSDAVEQVIIFGAGAFRMSASMLQEEVRRTEQQIRTDYVEKTSAGKSYLLDSLTEEELQSLKEESENRDQEQS